MNGVNEVQGVKEVKEVKRVQGTGIRVQSLISHLSSLIVKCLLACLVFLCPILLQAQGTITFSKPGGRYEHIFFLNLQCDHPSYHIHYTTNGGTPTVSSPRYQEPLLLSARYQSSSSIYKIQQGPDADFYIPDTVIKAIVIRAAAFDEAGTCVSPVVTQTYFIRDLGCTLPNLPVVSLCADSLALFDYLTGILVPGVHFNPTNPDWSGNYHMSGREWERNCNVEYYEPDNNGFNQRAGLRTHGGKSRKEVQKGLKVYAREEYGKKRFKYKIFDDCEINSFKHLVLKPFVCAWTAAGLQNSLSYYVARNLDLDVLDTRPVVLFLNGEYWGIYFIQEKSDERYLENHYDLDSEVFNIMGNWFGLLDAGSGDGFQELMDFAAAADFSDEEQYRRVTDMIDIHNFIDYQIMEIFSANADWPANNMRCWQAPGYKWRWIFFDGDACFTYPQFNGFENATDEGDLAWPTNARSTLLFRKLLQNESFQQQFFFRFSQLQKNEFAYNQTSPYLTRIRNEIKPEIKNQIHRFHEPVNELTWVNAVNNMDKFLKKRPEIVWQELNEYFDFPDIELDSLSFYPNPTQGHINIRVIVDRNAILPVSITDMQGRLQEEVQLRSFQSGVNIFRLDFDLPSGLYFIRIGRKSMKMVVSR